MHLTNYFIFKVVTTVDNPKSELSDKIHSLSVGVWPSFTLKLGLELGLADKSIEDLEKQLPHASFQAIKAAWLYVFVFFHSYLVYQCIYRELGLLVEQQGTIVLSELGEKLRKGEQDRDRAEYWLGPQLTPWLEASQRFHKPPSNSLGSILDSFRIYI